MFWCNKKSINSCSNSQNLTLTWPISERQCMNSSLYGEFCQINQQASYSYSDVLSLILQSETDCEMSGGKGLKQKLQAIGQGQQNLYSHLTNVLRQMLLDNPKNGYDLFEQYSLNIKKFKNGVSESQFSKPQTQHLKEYIDKTLALINKPKVGEQDEEPAQPGPTGYVPNIMEEGRWFQNVGVGFGEQLTYKIFKSFERFSIVKQIKQLKFWGKILGQKKDYYVAEGVSEGGQDGELKPGVEPRGQGVNKFTYWVSTDLNGDWTELPLVTPQQMQVSRRIKYMFTGDLQAPVVRNPFFPGLQKHLLKCQIVRITACCTIVPRTMYTVGENKRQIQPTAQWKLPPFEFYNSLNNWVHHPQNILKNGRLSHIIPQALPQGTNQEDFRKQLETKDPFEDRLKPISEDKFGNSPAWKLVVVGDTCNYRALGKQPQNLNYGFIALKSFVWKGFTQVYHNKQWSSIYVGYGFKTSDSLYYPCEPEGILQENKDREEQPEI